MKNAPLFTPASYENLINIIEAGIIFLDEDKKIIHWNNWFYQRSEFDIDDCKDKMFLEVFPELEGSRVEDAINNAIKLGFPSVVSNIFSRTPFPLYNPNNFLKHQLEDCRIQQSVNVAKFEIEANLYCLIHISDVSASVVREKSLEKQVKERKHAENALQKSEIRHRSIMETMVDGLIVFDQKGLIQSFNPAAEKIFSYVEVDIIGKPISLLIEDVGSIYEDEFGRNILSSKENTGVRQDGSVFPVELSISKMPLEDEIFYSAVIRDITERKKIDKMKRDFIATVSHELRTPLTSIYGSLGLLCGGIIDNIPPQASKLIDVANKNCERLIMLINDILDMEKITSGKFEFNFGQYEISDLVQQSIVSNESYAKKYNVSYVLIQTVEGLYVNVDEHRFQQIMSNLLSNAAKFSYASSQVEIMINAQLNHVEIDVKDYGQGIPEEFKKNIWNNFSQADNSNTREKGGTGLGLAISKSLIETMHGSISFTSTKSKGTIFQLRLPLISQ